jgi:hypothetical protein
MRFLTGILHLICLSLTSAAIESDSQRPFDLIVEDSDDQVIHLHASWESRYVSEGRDNLGGDGLIVGSLEATFDPLTLGLWYGNGPEADYDELQAFVAVSWSWKDLEWYVAYNHLQFLSDDTNDNELGVGVVWSGLPWEMTFGVDAYHSFDAEGSFFELAVAREFGISEKLSVEPYLVFGINSGYISDGHEGPNNIALGVEGTYAFNESFSAMAHMSYNWALDREFPRYSGDELLHDFFHVGIGLLYEF